VFLLVELCDFQGITSLKALYISSENIRNGSQTVDLIFHKLNISGYGTTTTTHISYIYKMYLKSVTASCALAFPTVLVIRYP